MHEISLHSRRKLKPADAKHFEDFGSRLFSDLATAVCSTGMLPQKELHECWQMANNVHREFPAILRVADIAAGHGLLAWILVLLARSGERATPRTAVAVDMKKPKSAEILTAAMIKRWPGLAGAVNYVEGSVDAVFSGDGPDTLFVAAHACGGLTDRVLLSAVASGSPVAIMPCCHSLRKQAGSLSSLAVAAGLPGNAVDGIATSAGEIGQPKAIDQFRIDALTALGYEIRESAIQPEITAFFRVIMGKPPSRTEDRPALVRPTSPYSGKRLGAIRAFEKVSSLNVSDSCHMQLLSRRPSCEWLRSFDLSYWVDSEAAGQNLVSYFESLVGRFAPSNARNVSIRDRYVDLQTGRRAFTYRIEIASAKAEISKNDATALRKKVCRAAKCLAHLRGAKIELRVASSV